MSGKLIKLWDVNGCALIPVQKEEARLRNFVRISATLTPARRILQRRRTLVLILHFFFKNFAFDSTLSPPPRPLLHGSPRLKGVGEKTTTNRHGCHAELPVSICERRVLACGHPYSACLCVQNPRALIGRSAPAGVVPERTVTREGRSRAPGPKERARPDRSFVNGDLERRMF